LQFSSVLSGRCRNSTLKQDLTISFWIYHSQSSCSLTPCSVAEQCFS
jgi:hypothetical protein